MSNRIAIFCHKAKKSNRYTRNIIQVYLLDFGFSVSPASQPSYFDIHFQCSSVTEALSEKCHSSPRPGCGRNHIRDMIRKKNYFIQGSLTPVEIWIFPAEAIHCPTKNPLIPSWHSGSPDKSAADSAFLPAEVSGSIRLCQTLESTSAVYTTITV